ncbi:MULTISPECIES: class I SAM-dependent methyltransferase [Sphingomonas]|uniref:class I SAM-dependent methyltransferase n=1 Tax=Sphingomonas TaxID=13687 RepID=UPI000B100982|nr:MULTISPECIES: class I SAM-dependent methyltransferase [Sphingomonas]WCP71030.1 methyltransferase domain-containing protein [Sphingomonas hankookensis]
MSAPDLFARPRRRLHRDRAQPGFARADFLHRYMLEGVEDRLQAVTRSFSDVLDLGCADAAFTPPPGARVVRFDPGFAFARAAGGVQGDEDRLPFADGAFDLVVSVGVLDSVNDLPGALTLIRRSLRPDGLFLAAFTGGHSLATLRQSLLAAEADRPAARVHPQIDLRSAGDLLVRAGFALPVADSETLTVRYSGLGKLVDDLRGMGATGLLEPAPLGRAGLMGAASAFAERADADGRTAEQFEVIYLTGWAPAPSQPQPARRGSATASLADTLRPPEPR